jgi:hypothetical protein
VADKVDYELSKEEAELLEAVTADALADAGAKGGGAGGTLGGGLGAGVPGALGGAAGGRSGGAKGGRFGTRFTKPVTAEETVEVDGDPAEVRQIAVAVVAAEGTLVDDPNRAGDDTVWGVVGSGAMNMAPALVRVAIEPVGAGRARVHVRATGREGLIKQKIGAKAADRIAAAIEVRAS